MLFPTFSVARCGWRVCRWAHCAASNRQDKSPRTYSAVGSVGSYQDTHQIILGVHQHQVTGRRPEVKTRCIFSVRLSNTIGNSGLSSLSCCSPPAACSHFSVSGAQYFRGALSGLRPPLAATPSDAAADRVRRAEVHKDAKAFAPNLDAGSGQGDGGGAEADEAKVHIRTHHWDIVNMRA